MTIRNLRRFGAIILVWALASVSGVSAQNTDSRLRLTTKLKKEIVENLNADIEFEYRRDQFLTTFDKVFVEPSVSYNFGKHIKIGAIYRLMYDQNSTRERGLEQRVAGYFRYDFDIDDFEVKLKTSLQYGFDDITNPSFSYDQKLVNRNGIEIEYNWFGSKFTPFAGYEMFYHINHPNGGIINQSRFKAGTSYQLSKKTDISAYYLFDNEFNVAFPVNAHVFGASISFEL